MSSANIASGEVRSELMYEVHTDSYGHNARDSRDNTEAMHGRSEIRGAHSKTASVHSVLSSVMVPYPHGV